MINRYFKIRSIKYFLLLLIIYSCFIILKRLFNVYTLLFIFISFFGLYYYNKKLFKKLIYKLIFRDKKNSISFNSKFRAARISLEELEGLNNKIKDKVKVEILNYEKNKLKTQLLSGDYNVTLFGAGSSGKTSIARALLKNIIGKTSPTIGTTKEITSYKIRIPLLKRNINIIDTPGLFEPSKKGEEREKITILKASSSDLVIFVLDQDINKYELYLIKELLKIEKKIIIVLNKCDLRTENENNIILENIRNITSSQTNNIVVVETIASPQTAIGKGSTFQRVAPEVNNLFREIIIILDNSGEELLADNILFRSNKLGTKSKSFIAEQRFIKASKIINKYIWITGGVILVNPLPGVDFLATTSVNVQMIIELSKVYEIKLNKKEAIDLSRSLLEVLAKLGIIKGGLTIISSSLASNFTTLFISKGLQSITASWLIKIVGNSLIEYFKNGQNWGDDGIQEVVNSIYRINKREEVIKNFVREAVNKIKENKYGELDKKLPPFS